MSCCLASGDENGRLVGEGALRGRTWRWAALRVTCRSRRTGSAAEIQPRCSHLSSPWRTIIHLINQSSSDPRSGTTPRRCRRRGQALVQGPASARMPLVARYRGKSIQIDLNNKEDLLTQTLERLRGNELAARFDRARASVTRSPDSTLLRRAGRVRRPTSPKGRTAATSSGAHAHPRSRAGGKSLFSPGHGPKALSSTAVGGTSSS